MCGAGAGVCDARPGGVKELVPATNRALAEEERGVWTCSKPGGYWFANTEQTLVQLAARIQEAAEREGRLAREREDFACRCYGNGQVSVLQQASHDAEQLVDDLRRQRQGVEEESERRSTELSKSTSWYFVSRKSWPQWTLT